MLKLLEGKAGSGKSALMMDEIRRYGEKEIGSILIVPEQYSHNAERRLCEACGDSLSLYGEVLSFSRLASRAGCPASLRTLDKGGRFLCMEKAFRDVVTSLSVLSSANRITLPAQLLQVYDQFRASSVSVREASEAVAELPGRLSRMLGDMDLIFQAYESTIPKDMYDPADVMDQLAECVISSGAVEGKRIYLDGFTDFTGQEMAVIRELLRSGNEITVALTVSDSAFDGGAYRIAWETSGRLTRLAESCGTEVKKEKIQNPAVRDPALSYWLDHLYEPRAESYPDKTEAISLYTAADLTGECELAASLAHRIVRETGCRWREVGVVARGWDTYESSACYAFDKFDVPVTRTVKSSLLEHPAVNALLQALDAVCLDWNPEAVLSWVYSGYSGVARESADKLENYMLRWNVRGSKTWRKGDWAMRPEGFSRGDEEKDSELLRSLNTCRKQIAKVLGKLEDALHASDCLRDMVIAVYAFLVDSGFSDAVSQKDASLRQRGELQKASEFEQVWDRLITALEQFAAVLGEEIMEPEEFSRFLRLLLGQYEIGTIPSTVDSVGIGDMTRMKAQGIRHLIILGADDSRLPTVSGGEALLSDTDCRDLRANGIELMDTADQRLEREMNVIVSSLSLAKDSVTLIRTGESGGKRPSFLTVKAEQLFSLSERSPGNEILTEAPMPCFEYACSAFRSDEETAQEARDYFSRDDEWGKRLEAARRASSLTRGKLSAETAKGLYHENINLTASKVEEYQRCRFSHFLQYGLRVKPRKQITLDAPESGNYIHYLMENVAREAKKAGGFSELSQADCYRLTDLYSERYITETLGGMETKSERFRYLFNRLTENARQIVLDMARELSQSDFQPLDFELDFSPTGEMDMIPVGDSFLFRGKVDRIDGWVSDGKLYLRVIDYKTGKKSFDLSDVWYGMGMQMLMYLFALETSGKERYGMEIVPAGVLYAPARDVVLSADRQDGAEKWQKQRDKELCRSGLLLNHDEVLEAMEHGEHVFLPVKVKKDGTISGDSLASLEQLGVLRRYLEKTLNQIGELMRDGEIDANPIYRSPMDNACQYCDYQEACHFREGDGGDKKRFLTKFKVPEVWEKMREVTERG